MVQRERPSLKQRFTVLAGVLGVHAIVLLLVLAFAPIETEAVKPPVMKLMSFAMESAAAPRSGRRVLPARKVAAPIPKSVPSLALTDSGTASGTALSCDTLDLVSQALATDPSAVDAIRSAPPAMRSVADAIVVWNAGWSAGADSADSPLAEVRAVVEDQLGTVSDECLDETIAGPRLVPIPDGDQTTFLAFGSGDWTWRQLLLPPPDSEFENGEPVQLPLVGGVTKRHSQTYSST